MEHRVTLASGDILRTRFATSALLEVLLALRTAQTASSPGPYDGWLRAVQPHLNHPDLRLLAPLVRPDDVLAALRQLDDRVPVRALLTRLVQGPLVDGKIGDPLRS